MSSESCLCFFLNPRSGRLSCFEGCRCLLFSLPRLSSKSCLFVFCSLPGLSFNSCTSLFFSLCCSLKPASVTLSVTLLTDDIPCLHTTLTSLYPRQSSRITIFDTSYEQTQARSSNKRLGKVSMTAHVAMVTSFQVSENMENSPLTAPPGRQGLSVCHLETVLRQCKSKVTCKPKPCLYLPFAKTPNSMLLLRLCTVEAVGKCSTML